MSEFEKILKRLDRRQGSLEQQVLPRLDHLDAELETLGRETRALKHGLLTELPIAVKDAVSNVITPVERHVTALERKAG